MVVSCLGAVIDRFLGDGGENMVCGLVKLSGAMGCWVSLGRGSLAYVQGTVNATNLWNLVRLSSAMGCQVSPGIRLFSSGKNWVEPDSLNLSIGPINWKMKGRRRTHRFKK